MFESISLSKNALEYLGCATLFHPVMGGAGEDEDKALDELQTHKLMVNLGEVTDHFGKVCLTFELTKLGTDYIGWLQGHRLINNGCSLDKEWMAKYNSLTKNTAKESKKNCIHNWVMDGHNVGDPICSKCYSRE